MMLKIFFSASIRIKVAKQQMVVKNAMGYFVAQMPAASIVFLSSLLVSTNAFSAAGDSINATATINYLVGGVTATSNASAEFTEDRKINFVVTELDGGSALPVVSTMSNAVMQFAITNTGNDTHDFLISAVDTSPNPYTLPADSFDVLPGTIRTFVESGVTPGYQATEDTTVFVDELSPNSQQVVYVLTNMPVLVEDDVAAIALIAQVAEGGVSGVEGAFINTDDNGRISPAGTFSNGSTTVPAGVPVFNSDAPSAMDSVFNDPAGANTEDVSTDFDNGFKRDVAGNGQHSDAGAYQAMSPVTINKTVTVIDTLGGSDPHAGATLRYQLDVSVVGNIAVDNLIISDVIPDNTTYSDASIRLNGVAQTDANDMPTDYSHARLSDADIFTKPVLSIEIDLSQGGSVAVVPGSTNTITFEVTIN